MDKHRFKELLTLLAVPYNKEITTTLLSAYYLVLSHLTAEQLQSAIKEVLTTRKYSTMPLPADILEAVNGNPDDRAIIALKQAEDAVSEFGMYKSVIFQDKALQATIEAFSTTGWIGFCELCGNVDWKFQKSEFTKLYKALAKQDRKPKSDYLLGWSEHQNRISGVDKEYDIEIEDGKVKVKGLSDRVENVYLVGYQEAPYCLPAPIVKALIKQQTPQIENKRDVVGLISVKKIDE